MGLETVELLMDIEDHFHVRLPDDDASDCITVGDLQNLLVRELSGGRPETPELRTAVWTGTLKVLKKHGHPAEKVRPESKWIGDIAANG